MTERCAIRAAVLKDFVEMLDTLPPDHLDRIRGRLSREARDEVEATMRVGWVPMKRHLEIIDVIRGVIDAPTHRRLWRMSMLKTFNQGTLQPLVAGAVRMFGITPASILKIAPSAWSLLFRDGGKVESHIDLRGKKATLTLSGFPAEHLVSGIFSEGTGGALEALFDFCSTDGVVRIVAEDVAAERVVYAFEWT